MMSDDIYELTGIEKTAEGSIVWLLKRDSESLVKRPPEIVRYATMMEMLRECEGGESKEKEKGRIGKKNEEKMREEEGAGGYGDEGWVKRLRKLAKSLIKIKNHRTHTFNEEVGCFLRQLGVSKEEFRVFFSKDTKHEKISKDFLNKIGRYVEKELV